MSRGKQPSIQEGQVFKDRNNDSVQVVSYESSTKVLVRWENGVEQYKSAQQLRSGKFSQRTRKTTSDVQNTVEQPYQRQDKMNQELSDNLAEQTNKHIQEENVKVSTEKPSSLFAD